MSEKIVYILRSLPGAGKSTLADKLFYDAYEKELRCDICSADDFFNESLFFNSEPVYTWSAPFVRYAHEFCQILFRRAVYHGIERIIIDNTNVRAKDLEFYYRLGKENGYKVEFVEPETEWKYNLEECAKRNKHEVPLEVIERMWSRWESTEVVLQKLKEMEDERKRTRKAN